MKAMTVSWVKAHGALLGTPQQRRWMCLSWYILSTLWDLRSPSGPHAQDHYWLGSFFKCQTEYKTNNPQAIYLEDGHTPLQLGRVAHQLLRCQVGAKLGMHRPRTSCADYLECMFLIHLHITLPGRVARTMWWPADPNESFTIFLNKFFYADCLPEPRSCVLPDLWQISKVGFGNPKSKF